MKNVNKRTKISRVKQHAMIKPCASAYGGDLLTTRAGRSRGRPISTRETMHLVLRSTQAKGAQSFLRPQHDANVRRIIAKFAARFGVRVLSLANVGNHLHLHLKLGNRFTFASFLRAVTGGIAMAVTGGSRWKSAGRKCRAVENRSSEALVSVADHDVNDGRAVRKTMTSSSTKVWDRRPFTRIVQSFRGFKNVADYIRLNTLEGQGVNREVARLQVARARRLGSGSPPG